MSSKIALGTAQFGMDYGINNVRGIIPATEVFEILKLAMDSGIDTLDTAAGYGDSEKVIGKFNGRFNIVSKLPQSTTTKVEANIIASLDRLKIGSFYGYLFHSFKTYSESPAIWEVFKSFKAKGKIQKIGFSLYYHYELETLIKKKLEFDLVQVPYSVFDQRFSDLFTILKKRGVEIHARSIFLQGLVFKRPENLTGNLSRIKTKLVALRNISEKAGVSIASLCLNFAALDPQIDKLVVGVDGLGNLKGLLDSLKDVVKVNAYYDELFSLREEDENILLPFNWQKLQ